MNLENEKILIEKYPKIFQDYDGDPYKTCMTRGFECGDGWFNIIDSLCEKIQLQCFKFSVMSDDPRTRQAIALQVKEKMGGLVFYIKNGEKEFYELIDEAIDESYITCEICGSVENVSTNLNGRIQTLCDKCRG